MLLSSCYIILKTNKIAIYIESISLFSAIKNPFLDIWPLTVLLRKKKKKKKKKRTQMKILLKKGVKTKLRMKNYIR